MDMKKAYQLLGIGIVAGLVLSLFFKWIEQATGHKVYTLLLNVDYIPVFRNYTYSEPVEVLFHLIVSIVLVFVLQFVIEKRNIKQIIGFCTLVNFLIGALIYPTTGLSMRTPPIDSVAAIVYWLIGHIVYGLVLGILLTRTRWRKTAVQREV
ncbi:hypothetical protein [Sporosarcina cyprini]|uniref:hypothetical protein n=1 Tax=Sporosarcina cyprini TaxID=2910523 RepID=UPI001EDDD587|nr:hypothetical protein [Sporosarcina cyprini]MCG3087882.1 hypothetical protein [Sporosarcina cyprini]